MNQDFNINSAFESLQTGHPEARAEAIKYLGEERYAPAVPYLAQLVEEVGEVARILSRTVGEQSSKPGEKPGDLADELADVMFVTICLANQSGIDLTDALQKNLDKKTKRDATRHLQNKKLDPN